MASKTPTVDSASQSTISQIQSIVERSAKGLAIYTGSIYILGYLVTAARLSKFQVSATKLIDAQYLIAGLIPGALLWLTLLVVAHANQYNKDITFSNDDTVKNWVLPSFLFLAILTIILFGILTDKYHEFINKYSLPVSIEIILLGEMAIWIVTNSLRRGFINHLWQLRANVASLFWVGFVAFLITIFIVAAILLTGVIGLQIYELLPQAFGGGKLHMVHLYVDPSKTPAELLDPGTSIRDQLPVLTTPMNLIFRTDDKYIIDPLRDGVERAWELDAGAVFAVVPIRNP